MRQSTFSETSNSPGPCPTDEELAAYIDGGLDPAESRRVTEHLASCEDCFEQYSETARFLLAPDSEALEGTTEEPAFVATKGVVRFPTLAERRSPVVQWLSLAALILAAVGSGAYVQFLAPPDALEVADVTASIQANPELAQAFWRGPTKRGAAPDEDQNVPFDDASFQMGVQLVNLQLSLRENDSEGTKRDILPRIFGILKAQTVLSHLTGSFSTLSADLESKPPRELLATVRPISDEARESFDETYLDLGKWVEAGRLAAQAEDPTFFQQGDSRKFLRHLIWSDGLRKRDERLDPPTLAILRQIAAVLGKGDPQASDYSKLRSLLEKILQAHYPDT
jgi:hypothetical protein